MTDRQIRQYRRAIHKVGEKKAKGYVAVLGKLDGTLSTGVANIVYVTTIPEGQVREVINRRVPNIPGIVVFVGVDEYSANRIEVLYSLNSSGNTNDGNNSYTNIVPPHSHSYPGYNTTWTYEGQIMPLNCLPIAGTLTVRVYPGVIRKSAADGWIYVQEQVVDLSGDVPSTSDEALWVTLQANDDGSVDYVVGVAAASRTSLSETDIPEPTTGKGLFAIILEEGRNELFRNSVVNDFFDLRFDRGGLDYFDAYDIPFTPIGGGMLDAANVGDALNELDFEKASVDHVHASTQYLPDSILVNKGTQAAGDVDSLQVANDGDVLQIDEVTGTPGFDLEVWFAGVVSFDQYHIRMWYDGGAGHTVHIDIWNNNTSSWETLQSITDQALFTWVTGVISDSTNYVDSYGDVKLRFYHVSAGNPAHVLYVDHTALLKSSGATSVSANDVGYFPGVLADWDYLSDPGSATDAFDQLAARITDLEAVAGVSGAFDYICIEDQKAQNTAGGTFTAGDWRTRTLNTEIADSGSHAGLSSNQITLDAGTYVVQISAPAFRVALHQARLRDITNGVTLLTGTSEVNASGSAAASTKSIIRGEITLAGATVLEVQHQCSVTRNTDGFGLPANFTTEVYTVVEFWKKTA